MEVLSPQNQSSDDWRSSSLDESWDSRLPTPLALDFSVGEEEGFTPYTNGGGEDLYISNGYRDSPTTQDGNHELQTEYLKLARRGGGHSDLLTIEPHTPHSEPVIYDKKDGQWYTHNGVDVQDTQQRKEMVTVPKTTTPRSSNLDSSVDIELETDYLKIAKRGGGHDDLLTLEPHTPTPEPVKYDKKDGQWYTHDGVDVQDTQQRKEMVTVPKTPRSSNLDSSVDIELDTDYLKIAKRGGGHDDLLTVEPHAPTPEPVKYDKKDGQWYTHDGVDIKETQQRRDMSLDLDDSLNNNSITAAGGKPTEYLGMAKKGGGHQDLLTVKDHVPSAEPKKYEKKGGEWYNQDDMVIKDGPQDSGGVKKPRRTFSDSAAENKAETEYLRTARLGGGHKDLLTVEPNTPSSEPVAYDKKDGQWYTHDGVDIKETQQRLDLSASINGTQCDDIVAAGEGSGEYLKLAKRGGGHDDLLTLNPHTPTPEPMKYDKKDGQWYTHDGVDVKETQSRKEMVTVASSPRPSNLDSSLEVNTDTEYLKLAKRGGGHDDLLTIDHHTPTPEPVTYDKTDGQWYTHDGVDVKETQQRRESAVSLDEHLCAGSVVAAGGTTTDYLDLAKKGGSHRDLLTVDPHTPTPEPVKYDKKDGQWYTHDGVDVKETQQRKDTSVTLESIPEDMPAAGGKQGEYLDVARKGGHKGLLTVEPHTRTPEPVKYEKKDGQWYAHDGVDVKETQSRKEMITVASSPRPSSAVDVETNTEYLKLAKKGGGHGDLLTVVPHTPTPEPVKYDKTDGQWYTHDGVDVKETQSRREMVTVASSPRSPSAAVQCETDYLKIAKKGGGHKDLLTIEPNTPRTEPVKYDKKDGQWYTHDGVDVKETHQRKEMVTVSNNSPRPTTLDTSGTETETQYLKLAKRGGGHKDLLTTEAHTPSPEPQKYRKDGGDWFRQDTSNKEAKVPPSPRQINSDDTAYLQLARKGGGHNDLLTITPHTPTPEPVKYNKRDGQWYSHDGVDAKDTQQRQDLLSHTPSPEPQRYEKKGGVNQDSVNGDRSKGRKGSPASPSPQINTDTEYLKKARKGGGHKDILAIEHHKPSPKPKKQERKLGDWYYHDETPVKRKEPPSSSNSPRKSTSNTAETSEYLRMARKGGGRKDLLSMSPQPQTSTPKPREVKQSGDTTPVSSPRNGTSSEPTDYLRLARKSGGHADPSTQDSPLRRSASMRVTSKSTMSDYLSTARKGGHHKDLLTMPENEQSNFQRDQASRRSLRSFRSPMITQVDGPLRPRTAEPRQSHPIWLGGSGAERVHSPGKRFINQSSRFAPFACHEGSPGAAKNPDKI